MIFSLIILLLVLLIFVGRLNSKKIILTLLYNAMILFSAVILMALRVNPLLVSYTAFICISLLTLFYQNGVNLKTVSAFLSLLIVVFLLAFLTWYLCVYAGICGLNTQTAQEDEILVLDFHLHINMIQVTYGMTLIGILGSVKDSAIAVATGTCEVYRNRPGITGKELFFSGRKIGKDILGVTINTLLFAGIGESILMFQMYFQYHYSFAELINSKSLIQAIVLILLGGIGVELSIPITAAIFCYFCTDRFSPLRQKVSMFRNRRQHLS